MFQDDMKLFLTSPSREVSGICPGNTFISVLLSEWIAFNRDTQRELTDLYNIHIVNDIQDDPSVYPNVWGKNKHGSRIADMVDPSQECDVHGMSASFLSNGNLSNSHVSFQIVESLGVIYRANPVYENGRWADL